jgi:hypothetical protein
MARSRSRAFIRFDADAQIELLQWMSTICVVISLLIPCTLAAFWCSFGEFRPGKQLCSRDLTWAIVCTGFITAAALLLSSGQSYILFDHLEDAVGA